jgi:hypothetical protein
MRAQIMLLNLLAALFILPLGIPGSGRPQAQVQASPAAVTATPHPGSEIQIISPRQGVSIQGSMPVIVDTTLMNFQSVELTFGYAEDASQTWFLIYQGIQPVTGTMLVLWDTSTITDGDYTLRMVVTFTDGSQKSVLAPGIRVRNYTPVETDTPAPIPATTTAMPASTPLPTLAPSPTQQAATPEPAPPEANPAELQREEVTQSIGKGVLVVFALFALAASFQWLKSRIRRK